jgi:ribosomal protein L11 methyltransferase
MSHLTSQSWIEVEIQVPRKAKDAVCNALGPFVLPHIQKKQAEQGDLWTIKGRMPSDRSVDDRLVNIEQGLRQIEKAFALDDALYVELGTVQGDEKASQYGSQTQRVFEVGRFIVASPDDVVQAERNRTVLRITAGLAFGDGSHSSTQVALELIDGLFRGDHGPPPKPGWCLDAGCGTGVLALAAAARWKGSVAAADISSKAIKRVKANLALNSPWRSRIFPVQGELSCCVGRFSVILANLVPSVLVNAHETLWTALEPEGWLMLAGFQEAQRDLVEPLFASKGAVTMACRHKKGWLGLLFRKPKGSKLS